MKKRKTTRTVPVNRWIAALLLWAGLLLPGCIQAQCEAENKAFKAGELVDYDLYFNWKFIWIKAGAARLGVKEARYKGKKAYQMDLLAGSSKAIDFFFRMRDTLTCVIGERMEPYYFRKGAEEASRYTVDEAWFSYQDGVAYVDQRRTYRDGEVVDTRQSDSRCIYDMLSILAQARSYDPADYYEGQKIVFPMATGREVEEQTLIYRGRDEVEANDGRTYKCLVFSLVEYNEQKEEQEVITFFITDDRNHLPVRLDMYLNIGSAKAFLREVKGNRYPLSAIVR